MALDVTTGLDGLKQVYYDTKHEAGYAGKKNLVRTFKQKIPPKRIEKWLIQQDAYTLHRPVRKKFPRLRYNVTNIDDVWEADLADLRSLKTYNDGFSYILVVIDVLSKYAWVEPLIDKTANEVIKAFTRILSRSKGRVPVYLQTDRGKEFVAKSVQEFLSEREIRFRVASNPDIKASIAERFNRTLKERMWRYFTHKKTHRYIGILQHIVTAYNHTKHSSIKMIPAAVTLQNAATARANLENYKKPQPRVPKYKINDYVRISKTKGTFAKGYEANWSEEIFKVISANSRRPGIPVYTLCDLKGEDIDGIFYQEELTPVNKDFAGEEFDINEIIKTRGTGRRKQLLVSWRGYPEKFNSWILASALNQKNEESISHGIAE